MSMLYVGLIILIENAEREAWFEGQWNWKGICSINCDILV